MPQQAALFLPPGEISGLAVLVLLAYRRPPRIREPQFTSLQRGRFLIHLDRCLTLVRRLWDCFYWQDRRGITTAVGSSRFDVGFLSQP